MTQMVEHRILRCALLDSPMLTVYPRSARPSTKGPVPSARRETVEGARELVEANCLSGGRLHLVLP
jgi:hypothetical protein